MPINSLAVAKRLTEAGFTPRQAEAQAELWQEIVESDLATKRDLKELELGLKRDHKDLDLKITNADAGLKRDIKDLETNLRRDFKGMDLKFERWQADNHRLILQLSIAAVVLFISIVGFVLRFMGRG